MLLSDLRLQPGQAGVYGDVVGDETEKFRFRAVDLGTRQVADAALEHLRVRGLVLQVLVVVVEHGRVQAHPVVRQIGFDAQLPGLHGLVLIHRQHHDGRDDILAAISQVAAPRLEAAGVRGVGHGVVAHIIFQHAAAGDLLALYFKQGRAGAPVEVGHGGIHLIIRVAQARHQAQAVRQAVGALPIDGKRIPLWFGIGDETGLAPEHQDLLPSGGFRAEHAIGVEIYVFANEDVHLRVQIKRARHPVQPAEQGFAGNELELLGKGLLMVDLRVEDAGQQKDPVVQKGREVVAVVVPDDEDLIVLVAAQGLHRERRQIPFRHQAVELAFQVVFVFRVLRQPARAGGGVDDALLRRAIGVFIIVLGGDIEAQVVRRLPQQAGAGGKVVSLVQFLVPNHILAEAVVVVGGNGGPQGRGVAQREIHRCPGPHQAVVAHGDVGLAGKGFGIRGLGDHIDGAAGGVLTEQSALRAAQHLDLLHIQKIRVQRKRRRHIDAIQMVGHGGVGNGVLIGLIAHAANGNDGLETLVLGDRHPGGDAAQVHERDDVAIIDVLLGQGRHRLRQVLQAFRAFFRRDDDLLKQRFLLLGRGGRHQESESGAQQGQRACGDICGFHGILLFRLLRPGNGATAQMILNVGCRPPLMARPRCYRYSLSIMRLAAPACQSQPPSRMAAPVF